jgi:gluconolactonase
MSSVFVKGLGAPETPRLMKDNSWVCVEMAPGKGGVTHISPSGKEVTFIAETGRPNGCMPDKNDVIWVAETHPHPSLMRVTMSGEVEVYLDEAGGEKMLFPNDLCFAEDGALYMTDSGILLDDWAPGGQLRPDWQNAEFDGRVYRIDLDTKEVIVMDTGIKFTNGIAIGPDGHVYANEMISGDIIRYEIVDGKPTGTRTLYGNVMAPDWGGAGFRGPDGMAFGANGYLYCAVFGQGDVTVLDTEGQLVRRIETAGAFPTNVAFGPDGEKKIYVTENEFGQIEVFDVETAGLPLYYGK